MNDEKTRLYFWEGLYWDIDYDINGNPYPFAFCPKQKCYCKLKKSKEGYSIGEYKYCCVKCDFKITLNKSIEDKGIDFIDVMDSLKYKDAEISYLKSLEKDPQYYKGLFNLGDAYYKQKNYEESTKVFQNLSQQKLDKENKAQAYHNLGNSLLQSIQVVILLA